MSKQQNIQRPPEPHWLIEARAVMDNWPPRLCHTCEHFGNDGICRQHGEAPPPEFASTLDACSEWEQEIPL